mgnify:FL=1
MGSNLSLRVHHYCCITDSSFQNDENDSENEEAENKAFEAGEKALERVESFATIACHK